MRTQQRGPITDTWPTGELAVCECVHGKVWPEGDWDEAHGGRACEECVREWQAATRAEPDKPMHEIARDWKYRPESSG